MILNELIVKELVKLGFENAQELIEKHHNLIEELSSKDRTFVYIATEIASLEGWKEVDDEDDILVEEEDLDLFDSDEDDNFEGDSL